MVSGGVGNLPASPGQPQSPLCILQLRQASSVAAFFNQRTGLGQFSFVLKQPGAGQGDVGEMELHAAALGDALGFGEIGLRAGEIVQAVAQPGAGEEATGEMVHSACLAQAGDGGFGVLLGVLAGRATVQQVGVERATGEGQVVEGEGKKGGTLD